MSAAESKMGKDAEISPFSAVQMSWTVILEAKEWVCPSQSWQQILNRGDQRVPEQ